MPARRRSSAAARVASTPGDEILTVGGIYGIVQELEPEEDGGDLVVEIADGHPRPRRPQGARDGRQAREDEDDEDEDADEADDEDVAEGEPRPRRPTRIPTSA